MIDAKLPLGPRDRARWLAEVTNQLERDFHTKYLRGQEEHGGDIGNVDLSTLFDQLYQEHLDAIAYINEIRRRLKSPQFVKHLVNQLYGQLSDKTADAGSADSRNSDHGSGTQG